MLSDGQRIILAMVADIAYKAASLNSQLEEKAALETPGIVLIDEIDWNDHPNWQRKIVDSLKTTFPKIQFIATTHSPFIIQSCRVGELIEMNESEPAEYADQSIENIAEYKMGVKIPQRQDDPDILNRLIQVFPGTCHQCFDSNGQPTPRCGGEL